MNETRNRQRRVQPLNHSEFHILLALADGDRHGYGIMQEVEQRSGGSVKLGPGTLYGAIKRLMGAGMIEESDRRADQDDQRRRCYYRLTGSGREAVREEAARLADLVRIAEEKRLLAPGSRTVLESYVTTSVRLARMFVRRFGLRAWLALGDA